MYVRVVEGVHADDGRWWAALRKHSNEDKKCVVDPIKLVVELYILSAPSFAR